MKESQILKEIIRESIDESALGKLAKIPAEIIDKEGAQEYIKWNFYTAPMIGLVLVALVFLFFFLFLIAGCVYEITKEGIAGTINTIKQDFEGFLFVASIATFIVIGFIVVFAMTIYDLRLRYKVLKKSKEKNQIES
jgi:hypothetical protein